MARLSSDDPIIVEKTLTLCETIVSRPGFQTVRDTVTSFMADDVAREKYFELNRLSQTLAHRQAQGETISEADQNSFEKARRDLESMPIAAAFMDAQHQLHKVEATLHAYITRTLQLGRVPEESDFASNGCGPSCGCHSQDVAPGHAHS